MLARCRPGRSGPDRRHLQRAHPPPWCPRPDIEKHDPQAVIAGGLVELREVLRHSLHALNTHDRPDPFTDPAWPARATRKPPPSPNNGNFRIFGRPLIADGAPDRDRGIRHFSCTGTTNPKGSRPWACPPNAIPAGKCRECSSVSSALSAGPHSMPRYRAASHRPPLRLAEFLRPYASRFHRQPDAGDRGGPRRCGKRCVRQVRRLPHYR